MYWARQPRIDDDDDVTFLHTKAGTSQTGIRKGNKYNNNKRYRYRASSNCDVLG
jgi:hypothetical protein